MSNMKLKNETESLKYYGETDDMVLSCFLYLWKGFFILLN
jgi:hypothetical protein